MPVYKTKTEKTKDNKIWYFKCNYRDVFGNIKQKKSKKYATKEEAIKEEAKFKLDNGIDNEEKTKITIYDAYKDYFFNDVYNNKESSLYTKESRVRIHILPFFYDEKNKKYCTITKINVEKINKWKKWLEETEFETHKKDKKGKSIKIKLSIAAKQANYSAFSSLMRYAVEKYKLEYNPMKLTENFRDSTDKVVESEPIRYITQKEYNLFITALDNEYKVLFHFLYEIGCRRGEMQAITWEDINFKKGQVKINKTLATRNISKTIKITNTKNKKIRYIDISKKLIDELKELYIQMSKLDGFSEKWFVFGGIRYIPSSTLTRIKDNAFNSLIKQGYNINKITIHEFRHSSASYMISNGIPAEIIAYRLGDTVETIRRVYAHLFPDTQKDAKGLFDKL